MCFFTFTLPSYTSHRHGITLGIKYPRSICFQRNTRYHTQSTILFHDQMHMKPVTGFRACHEFAYGSYKKFSVMQVSFLSRNAFRAEGKSCGHRGHIFPHQHNAPIPAGYRYSARGTSCPKLPNTDILFVRMLGMPCRSFHLPASA